MHLLDPPQLSFEVGILSIFGQLEAKYKEKLKENYCMVDKGYNSFPTNLPGTAYSKALLVSNILTSLCNIIWLLFSPPSSSLIPYWVLNEFLKARKRLSQIVSEIICGREEKKPLKKDLLWYLMNSRDERGQTALTKDQIADNIIGVLFAAQDTTASALTWILKYLHDDRKLFEAVKVEILSSNHVSFIYLCRMIEEKC
jgi:(+)-abscisic acid 8'-hydroxylase